MNNLATVLPVQSHGWQAHLDLTFAQRDNKTVLVKRQQFGPLTVQRPFYPEGDVPHVYLLHPPGGVVAGDELSINVSVETGGHALVTTPAAGKFYRSYGNEAKQNVTMRVEDDAILEWLPQETIVYDGAKLNSTAKINLARNARFIGWEIMALGRPACGEGFANGVVEMNWLLNCEQQPLLIERIHLDAVAFAACWGMQNSSSFGSLFVFPASADMLLAAQDIICNAKDRGVTRIDNVLICRAKDERSDRIRSFFEQIWRRLRPECLGRDACVPRIWAT